jgi:large conductance mechanosensitive channel
MLAEFKSFLTKSNALALAVGVILAFALGAVVGSLVNDILMPPIGYLLGGVDFSSLKIVLQEGDAETEVAIRWGLFINTVITFVIVAFVVFLIGRYVIREAPPADPGPSDEVKLLTEIRDSLRKG